MPRMSRPRSIVALIGLVAFGIGTAHGQSACLPPMDVKADRPAATQVAGYVVALSHADRAIRLLDSTNTSNMFLNFRLAVGEMQCAKRLVTADAEITDTSALLLQSLDKASTTFEAIAGSLDNIRAQTVRSMDAGVAPSAADRDRMAENQAIVQGAWRQLTTVTVVVIGTLQLGARGDTIVTISRADRAAILATIRSTFGRTLTSADARKNYALFAAEGVQGFLLHPRWKFR